MNGNGFRFFLVSSRSAISDFETARRTSFVRRRQLYVLGVYLTDSPLHSKAVSLDIKPLMNFRTFRIGRRVSWPFLSTHWTAYRKKEERRYNDIAPRDIIVRRWSAGHADANCAFVRYSRRRRVWTSLGLVVFVVNQRLWITADAPLTKNGSHSAKCPQTVQTVYNDRV